MDEDANLVSPRWFQRTCEALHRELAGLDEGQVADYIPELANARRDAFGLAAMGPEGTCVGAGDRAEVFTIQSISKLVTYAFALEMHGRNQVFQRVGVAPTGNRFNAIELDEDENRAPNPMVNAGAIAITDMLEGTSREGRLRRLLDLFERYLGRRPKIDEAVWESERRTGSRNRAIAYLMLSQGIVADRVEESLDVYFAQCSIQVTVNDLARLGAIFANGGIDPCSGRRILERQYVSDLLTVALTCGMYDYAGEWAYAVGIPAKSGVSGGIVGAVPGRGGIAVWSPPLDALGNSVRGIRAFEALSRTYGLHIFNPEDPMARAPAQG